MDGRITPAGTFHISRAYGARPPMQIRPVEGPPSVAKIELGRGEARAVQSSRGVSRLVAGVVRGRIDFAGDEPRQDAAALPMYRHPADRNAAATAVDAGRMLDVTG